MARLTDQEIQARINRDPSLYDSLREERKSAFVDPRAAKTIPTTPNSPLGDVLEGGVQFLSGGKAQSEQKYQAGVTPYNVVGEIGGAVLPPLTGAAVGALLGGPGGAAAGAKLGGLASIVPSAARIVNTQLDKGEPLTLTNTALPIALQGLGAALPVSPLQGPLTTGVTKLAPWLGPKLGSLAATVGSSALGGYLGDLSAQAGQNLEQNRPFYEGQNFGQPGLGTLLGVGLGAAGGTANLYAQRLAETNTAKQAQTALEMGLDFAPVANDPTRVLNLRTGESVSIDDLLQANPGKSFDPTGMRLVDTPAPPSEATPYTPPPAPLARTAPSGPPSVIEQLTPPQPRPSTGMTLYGQVRNDYDQALMDGAPLEGQFVPNPNNLVEGRVVRQLPGDVQQPVGAATPVNFNPDAPSFYSGAEGVSPYLKKQKPPTVNEMRAASVQELQRANAADATVKQYLRLFASGLDPSSDMGQAALQGAINERQHLFNNMRSRKALDDLLRNNGIDPASLNQKLRDPRRAAEGGFMAVGNVAKTAEKKSPNLAQSVKIGTQKLFNFLNNSSYMIQDAAEFAGGQTGVDKVIQGTLTYNKFMDTYVTPVLEEAQKLGVRFDIPKADQTVISQYFRDFPLADIQSGDAPWPSNLDARYKTLVKGIATGLYYAPKESGFVGRVKYDLRPGRGYLGEKDQPLFNLETGQRTEKPTKAALEYKSMTEHRVDIDGNDSTDANPVMLFQNHMDRIATQNAFQPLKVVNGQAVIDESADSAWRYFKTIYDTPEVTQSERDAAEMILQSSVATPEQKATAQAVLDTPLVTQEQRQAAKVVLDRIKRKPIVDPDSPLASTEKMVRTLQGKYSAAVLAQRLSAVAKNLGPILGLTDYPMTHLLQATHDAFGDPWARRLLAQQHLMTEKEMEFLFARLTNSVDGQAAGWDLRNEGERFMRAITILGRLRAEGVSYKDAYELTDAGRKALGKAYVDLKKTQPNYSKFSMRPAQANTAANFILMFKNAKLSEAQAVMGMVANNDLKGLARYAAVGYLIGGPRAIMSADLWRAARASGLSTALNLDELATAGEEGTGYGLPWPTGIEIAQNFVGNADASASFTESFFELPKDYSGEKSVFDAWLQLTSADENKQAKGAESLARTATTLGNLAGTKSIGGVNISADFLGRVVRSGKELLGPDTYEYGKLQLEKNPVGAIARTTISGNKDKTKVRNISGLSDVGGTDFRIMVDNTKRLAQDPTKANAYLFRNVSNYVDKNLALLQQRKKYQGLTPAQIKQAVEAEIIDEVNK